MTGLLSFWRGNATPAWRASINPAWREVLALASLALLATSPVEAQPHAYVTNQASEDRVWVVDTETNTVVDTVTVEDIPARVAITPDGVFAYVTIVVNEDFAQQSGVLRSSVVSSPVFLSSHSKSLAANSFFSNKVVVIDTATNAVVATVTTEDSAPFGIAVTPDGASAYVTHLGENVSVIDTATNTVVAIIPIGGETLDVAITPDGDFAYIPNSSADYVAVIDTATNTVVATVPVGDSPGGIAITPDGTFAYVTNGQSDDVSVINIPENAVVDIVPVHEAPSAIAITPDGGHAYVTNQLSNDVSVIEIAGNTVIATVGVGDTPIDVAIRPDGAFAYVTNIFSESVSVIDTAANALTETVPVGFLPEGIAIMPEGSEIPGNPVVEVTIDIKPGNHLNRINPRSNGGVWVAILSGEEIDALQIDPATVRFGRGSAAVIRSGVRDINRDSASDLLLRFSVSEAGIECGDTGAALSGQTYSGQHIVGEDVLKTVGCK